MQVTGCPDVVIPFLTPDNLKDHNRNLQRGHIHLPLSIEESLINGGQFVFNRGKSILFIGRSRSLLYRYKDRRKTLSEEEEDLLKSYLNTRSSHLKEELGSSYDSEELYQKVHSSLTEELGSAEDRVSCLQINIKLVDILTDPPLILAENSTVTDINLSSGKLKPLLKANINLLQDGSPYGELSIAVIAHFFETKLSKKMRTKFQNYEESQSNQNLLHASDNRDVQHPLKFNLNLKRTIYNMITKGNKSWKGKILYENPYVIKFKGGMLSSPWKFVNPIRSSKLECFLESNYDVTDSSVTESSAILLSETSEYQEVGTKVNSEKNYSQRMFDKKSEDKIVAEYNNALNAKKKGKSKAKGRVRPEAIQSEKNIHHTELKRTSGILISKKPSGWLGNFTSYTEKNRRRTNQITKIHQTKTTFLRRALVDPELSKHMQAEIDRKLKEELKRITESKPRKNIRKIICKKQDTGQQTETLRPTISIDQSTAVGNSLQSGNGVSSSNGQAAAVVEIGKGIRSEDFMNNLNQPSSDTLMKMTGARQKIIRTNTKESSATLEKINSLNDESVVDFSKASFEAGNLPTSSLSIVPDYRDSQITFGQTYTISENLAKNIRNASELEKTNTTVSDGSNLFAPEARYVLDSEYFENFEQKRAIPKENESEDTARSDVYEEDFDSDKSSDGSIEEDYDEEILSEMYSDDRSTTPDEIHELGNSSENSNSENKLSELEYQNLNFFDSSTIISAGEIPFGTCSTLNNSKLLGASDTFSTGQLLTSKENPIESLQRTNERECLAINGKLTKSPSSVIATAEKTQEVRKETKKSEDEDTISNISEKISAILRKKPLPRQRLNTDSVSSYIPSDMEDFDDIDFEGEFEELERELKNLTR